MNNSRGFPIINSNDSKVIFKDNSNSNRESSLVIYSASYCMMAKSIINLQNLLSLFHSILNFYKSFWDSDDRFIFVLIWLKF